jgi:hypothetical protein
LTKKLMSAAHQDLRGMIGIFHRHHLVRVEVDEIVRVEIREGDESAWYLHTGPETRTAPR